MSVVSQTTCPENGLQIVPILTPASERPPMSGLWQNLKEQTEIATCLVCNTFTEVVSLVSYC